VEKQDKRVLMVFQRLIQLAAKRAIATVNRFHASEVGVVLKR
jgi:hypothetical protein